MSDTETSEATGAAPADASEGDGKLPVALRSAIGLSLAALVGLVLWIDSFWPPGYIYAAFGTVTVALGADEYYGLAEGGERRLSRPGLAALCAGFFLLQWAAWAFNIPPDPGVLTGFLLAACIIGALAAVVLTDRPDGGAEAVAFTATGLVYVPFLLGFLTPVRMLWGSGGVLFVLATCKSCDSAAYYAGTYLGRHKLAPNVSPNKTIEGLAGGMVGSAGVALLLAAATPWNVLSPGPAILYGAGAGAVTALGDLAESVLKRDSNVKDSSSLISSAGGVLDLLDGVLFAAPYSLAYFYLFAA